MKHKKSWYIIMLFTLVLSGCHKESSITDFIDSSRYVGIYGTWVEDKFENGVRIMKRANELDPNIYGFSFYQDGNFVEMNGSGRCATPQVSRVSYKGNWKPESDGLIKIEVGGWDGINHYSIEIVSYTYMELRIIYH